MDKPITSTLRTMFIIHLIAGLVFGLGYLLIPDTVANLFNYPWVGDPMQRLLGAAILGFSLTSLLALMAERWQQVRIVVMGEVLWTFLAALIILWFLIDGSMPALFWGNFALMAFFALGFGYCYWKEETVVAAKLA
jgi:hypothetical protein